MLSYRQIGKIVTGLLSVIVLSYPAQADTKVLQGGVQAEDEILRLNRPANALKAGAQSSDVPLRLDRPVLAPDFHKALSGLVDTQAFNSAPLTGRATRDDPHFGLLKPADFGTIPNSKFDLGADRGSKELTLAWEAWHHQLSQAIYRRWSDMASVPGEATLRITVDRNRHIIPMLVRSNGNREFDRGLLAAVRSLDGNPGLSFPTKSERVEVSLESDYVAATDVQPGFSWVKNDYEHISHNY